MSNDRRFSVLELLRWTTDYFTSRGIANARLDAELLLAAALGLERLQLYLEFDKPVDAAERARFRGLVRRRASERVPVAYLVGVKEFWSLPLHVTPDVLVPRPETEVLVAAALDGFPQREVEFHALDLGTGSGAIALALAVERPKARVTAIDRSPAALVVARENAERVGVAERLRFLCGDWGAPVRGESFDLVVANPPYVAEAEAAGLAPELFHEPASALFAGSDGMQAYEHIAAEAPTLLKPAASLLFEVTPQRAQRVADVCRAVGLREVEIRSDLAGWERVVVARRPVSEER